MELVLAVVALIVGLVSLGLTLKLWSDLARVHESVAAAGRDAAQARDAAGQASREAAAARSTADGAERALAEVRAQLTPLQEELERLRIALETSPPPLPQARKGSLEDLRERLRAEQETAADDEDET